MARDAGTDAAAGVFAVALLCVFVALWRWELGWLWVSAPLMLGVLVATARRRRSGPDPDVTLGPDGSRPWRGRDSEE